MLEFEPASGFVTLETHPTRQNLRRGGCRSALQVGLGTIAAAGSRRHHDYRNNGAGAHQGQAGARKLSNANAGRAAGLERAALLTVARRSAICVGGLRPQRKKHCRR